MHGDQADGWREAATLEYNTLGETGTFEIVDLPMDQKAIGSGWVFQVKHNADGSIERFKARILAKGYSQRPGLDYNESFAPTFCPATLRIIIWPWPQLKTLNFVLWTSHPPSRMEIWTRRST